METIGTGRDNDTKGAMGDYIAHLENRLLVQRFMRTPEA